MILNRLAFWLRECMAILFWSLLLIKSFIFDFDAYFIYKTAPDYLWLLNLKILFFMIFTAFIWLILGQRSFWKLFAYIIGYPVIILFWRFPCACLKNWPIAIAFAPVMYSIIKRFRSIFFLYTIAMVSIAIILLSTSQWQLIIAIICLLIFQINHIFRSFREAFSESLFAELAGLTRKTKTVILKALFQDQPNTQPSTSEDKTSLSKSLLPVYVAHACTDIVAQRVAHVIKTRKYDMYLVGSWFYTFSVTIIVYTFLYFGISRLDPNAFSPPNLLSLPHFLHFSIGTITATGNSGIQAVSPYATATFISECLHIPILIIIFVFIILTTQREHYRQDAEDFRLALRELSDAIERQIFDVYKTTTLILEVSIHKHNAWLVNKMRGARGMPEILNEDPQNPEKDTDLSPSNSVKIPPKDV